jgi:exopolysaccharide biosynthesis polyprenyl glycosylphosphotransferase
LPIWIGGMQLYGLYDRDSQRPDHSTVDDIGRIIQLVAVGTWIWVALMWVTTSTSHTSTTLVFFVAAVTLVPISRACARAAVRRHPHYRQNTLIVGAGEVGQLVGRKLVHHPEFGIRVVGFVDAEPKQMRGDLEDYPVLGPPSDIVDLVERYEVDRVIVAFSNDRHDLLVNLVRSLRELDVQIDLVPRLFEAVGPVVYMHGVEGLPLVGLPPSRHPRLACRVKRIGDVVVAGGVLVFTLPLFALIALRIKLDSPGPVFFRQQRLGQDQRVFTLLKFRTMTVDTDDAAHREYLRGIMDTDALPSENNLYKLDRSSQITRAGAWLRHTSLDELPQLINVLRGEMSLVGPRPCIAYETELFEPHHFDRFLVPGGMTGLWQVEARAHATFKEALDLDVAYARNWSLRLDLWLLARTPVALLRGRVTA